MGRRREEQKKEREKEKRKPTKGGQFQGETLQCVWCLVHDQHIQHDVILVDVHVCLSINRIREPGQLNHLTQLCRRSVLFFVL